MRKLLLFALLLSACHARAQTPSAPPIGGVQAGPSMESDPTIVGALLELMAVKDNTHPDSADFSNTSLKDLLSLGTPSGFHLRNRYTRLGVSLSGDMAVADDPQVPAHRKSRNLSEVQRSYGFEYDEISSVAATQQQPLRQISSSSAAVANRPSDHDERGRPLVSH